MEANCGKIHYAGKVQVSFDGLSAWQEPQRSSTIWASTENQLESFFPPSPSGNGMHKKGVHGNRGCSRSISMATEDASEGCSGLTLFICDSTADTKLRNPWPTKKETSLERLTWLSEQKNHLFVT